MPINLRTPRTNRLYARIAILGWWWATTRLPVVKRTIDLAGVIVALIMLSPLFLVVSLLIKAYDRGPVLFWQYRVGKHGRLFPFPKFRSMRVDAEAVRAKLLQDNQHGSAGVTFKMKNDPRITPVGRFIRRFSIDELPQLWCILRGDMSLVGPRPPIVSEVERYTLRDRTRLEVTPGLTSIWAVSGRSEIPFEQQVEMDIEYIQTKSVANDVKLLARTLPAVIKGKGAY